MAGAHPCLYRLQGLRRQDKGQAAELKAFAEAVARGGPMPIAWRQLVDTTRVTFAILESLRKGTAIKP